ncbi:RNA polymerase sigma-70 factor [Paraflavitalea sp. CAU 1676]|uniref:RNA polymerase sigma-70 factor n=1 Tax=Paraflavitalea sp. CAU 1676 TaxID=3032598 RepID=UPI0023DAAD92|nr:RNA polymerase sigma-70 factor [Paraflavitalea sp. CAU 1676]MDF2186845.1 RNA polymerase sigma-70 factor [Paraflavitalea sp. CAU 1676]
MEHHQDHEIANTALLLQRVEAGDQLAFRELYHIYNKRLHYFAFALVKTKEAAEEIVEDVFIRLWNQRNSITSINNLRIYLYTATKNTALNYLARKARENIVEPFDNIDIALQETGISPEQIMITAETYQRIRQAVEALPPRCKMIFKLIREDGLRYKEVAEILNISINTIDAQMAIAIQRITEAVRKDFEKFPRNKSSLPKKN